VCSVAYRPPGGWFFQSGVEKPYNPGVKSTSIESKASDNKLSDFPKSLIKLKEVTNMKHAFLAILLAVAIMAVSVQGTEATPMLLGTTGYGGTISTLVEIDPTTGATIRTIGSVGYAVNALEYDATTGKLYGGTSLNDPTYNGLIEIDLTTGAGTPIGTDGWGFGESSPIIAITVDSTGQMFGWYSWTDNLVSINTSTGVATVVGDPFAENTFSNALDFDSSDTLYMINQNGKYYTIDTATAEETYVNQIGSWNSHHGDFDPTSDLWYSIDWEDPRNLIVTDLSAGSSSSIGVVGDLHTLTFVESEPIPEPTTIVLVGFGLLGVLGIAIRKRRKVK
jgi:hypothetical protein